MIHLTVLRAAVAAVVFVVLGAVCASQVAAFSYGIDVSGNGVTATGSITFPTDAGSDPAGIVLSLDGVLFGNSVSFTEADLVTAGWSGAAPNDLNNLLVDNLSLFAFVGDKFFLLSDNGPTGNGLGDAVCTDTNGGVCGVSTVTWTYTAQQVPEPSTALQLLAGLSAMLAGWRGRRIWQTCRAALQHR